MSISRLTKKANPIKQRYVAEGSVAKGSDGSTRPSVPSSPTPANDSPRLAAHSPGSGNPTRKRTRSVWRYLAWGIVLALGLVLILGLGLAAALLYRSSTIAPGVQVAGLDMSGQTLDNAAALLEQHWQQQGIVLAAPHAQQAVVPEALGMRLDTVATMYRAREQGRTLDSLQNLLDQGQVELEPIWTFDDLTARRTLQSLAPQFTTDPIEADIRLVEGRVEAVPAVEGQTIDIEATLAAMARDPEAVLETGRLEIGLKPVQAALTDVSQPVGDANALLSHAVTISAYDPIADERLTWRITARDWSEWLSISLNETDPTQFDWSLDLNKARDFFASENGPFGPDRYLNLDEVTSAATSAISQQEWLVDLRLYHRERRHKIAAGESLSSIGRAYGIPYPWIEQANPGLSQALLTPGQVITIPSPDLLIPLPPVENKRIVVSLSQQKMWGYQDGQQLWDWWVSSGLEDSPTSPGVFQVQNRQEQAYAASWDLWMPSFIGIYQPSPISVVFNGFHGYPWRDDSTLLWRNDLGRPVTYGCLMVDSENAIQLYKWAEDGVIVEIQP
ncbi:MAG TPA: L,D-transpeptidase family protein [Anaerolineae bacterium]|nr:L,D-transpeptidase family protein [Anaerolineae bacterium]HMR65012.1 L,D-transpeptidase family protein [Anaerolineae bacterium]